MEKIRIAIVGPTGYTGYWLIKLLQFHPNAEVSYLASHREQLPNIADEFPALRGICELDCQPIDADAIAENADVVFTGLPHKAAMQYIPYLLDAGLKVVDLSADYRLNSVELYEAVYQTNHEDAGNLDHAVYGLPEFFERDIKGATLVANPGCYPTAAALGIAPLLQRSLAKNSGIIINASSGVSGAGRSAKPHLHYPEVNEGYMAYAMGNHRHQPEIEQTLGTIKGEEVSTLFVPHLLPVKNGILETIYLKPQDAEVTEDELFEAFEDSYGDAPFVRVTNDLPNIKNVQGTNFCDITVKLVGNEDDKHIVVQSVIDNMVKGASGQAIQNMNLLFGLDQTTGLL